MRKLWRRRRMMKASQLRHRFPLEGMTLQKGEERVNQMHSRSSDWAASIRNCNS